MHVSLYCYRRFSSFLSLSPSLRHNQTEKRLKRASEHQGQIGWSRWNIEGSAPVFFFSFCIPEYRKTGEGPGGEDAICSLLTGQTRFLRKQVFTWMSFPLPSPKSGPTPTLPVPSLFLQSSRVFFIVLFEIKHSSLTRRNRGTDACRWGSSCLRERNNKTISACHGEALNLKATGLIYLFYAPPESESGGGSSLTLRYRRGSVFPIFFCFADRVQVWICRYIFYLG